MTGGVKGYRSASYLVFSPERNAFELGLFTQPQMKKGKTGSGAKITLVTRPGMIAVSMRNESSFHRAFGIDVKVTCRAINPRRRYDERSAGIV